MRVRRLLNGCLSGMVALAGCPGFAGTGAVQQPARTPARIEFPLPEGVGTQSVGCVAVGMWVDKDGATSAPRILQGAFSKVDAEAQAAWQRSVLASASKWQFTPAPSAASSQFVVLPVGFAPDGPTLVQKTGAREQYVALRTMCEIPDLATWGEEKAVPPEQARTRNGGRIMVMDPGTQRYDWVAVAMTAPHYPVHAMARGVTGCVVVAYVIGENGSPTSVKIASSSFTSNTNRVARTLGSAKDLGAAEHALEQSALEAATLWKFAPGPDNLARMPLLMQTPVAFDLGGNATSKCPSLDASALLATPEAK